MRYHFHPAGRQTLKRLVKLRGEKSTTHTLPRKLNQGKLVQLSWKVIWQYDSIHPYIKSATHSIQQLNLKSVSYRSICTHEQKYMCKVLIETFCNRKIENLNGHS